MVTIVNNLTYSKDETEPYSFINVHEHLHNEQFKLIESKLSDLSKGLDLVVTIENGHPLGYVLHCNCKDDTIRNEIVYLVGKALKFQAR
jgi:hypothetical protein